VDFEPDLIGDLEFFEPAREGFASGVGIEGSLVGLDLEPSVGDRGYITMILSTDRPGCIPLRISLPFVGVLEGVLELHDREGTDGVPLNGSCWVSILVEANSLGR